MDDGLRVLFDDDACLKMSQCIIEMGVAEIFVEDGGAEISVKMSLMLRRM